jgi:ubiquitin-protein ligase
MASPRTRRLLVDAESIRKRLAGWPLIEISGAAGIPPEIYRFTYRIKGLYVDPTGNILERDTHILEVNLSLGYPRRAPQCRMLTPVFHPNFDDATVCIGDFWAASEGLDDLVIRIGRMIAYQEYNTKSPLNGLAAKWAAQNAPLLPIDARGIAPPSREDGERQVLNPEAALSAFAIETARQVIAAQEAAMEALPDSSPDPWAEKIVIQS